jgi:plastocyanin
VQSAYETADLPASEEPPAITVTYRDDTGFLPARVEIDLGQVVRFVNESDRRFWPASNIHPTHQIYPDFDPKALIPPGESWLFTFDQAGFWRYHNHLAPSHSALVVVAGEATASGPVPLALDPTDISFKELGTLSAQDATDLFRDDALLATFVKDYGPAETVRLLSENAAQIGLDCHERAHVMGRIAYELFGAMAFSLSGHECHSGSYHGATEAFFRDRGTTNLASDVEAMCGNSLNGFFRHQCVHGIGHGLMAWTSYELLDALQLCDGLAESVNEQSCYSGVFMENVVGGLSGSMGHLTEYLSDDPHFPCNILEKRYVEPCYFFQTSRMVQLSSGDFAKVAQDCAEAPEFAHRLCFQSMGRDVGGATRGNPKRAIEQCSFADDPRDRLDCLDGAVQDSFWDVGGADNALAFCGLLKEAEEKSRCYTTIIARAHDIYQSPSELQRFCARVEEGYRKQCP